MRAYSEDIRARVVRAHTNREASQREIARRFDVSLGFVRNLLKRYRETGSLAPKENIGAASKLDDASLEVILRLVDEHPTFSLSGLCEELEQEIQLRVSRSTMWRIVKKYRPRKEKLVSASRENRAVTNPSQRVGNSSPLHVSSENSLR